MLPLVLLPLLLKNDKVLKTYVVAIVIGWLFIRTEARSLLSLFAVPARLRATSTGCAAGGSFGAAVALNIVIILVSTNVVTDPGRYFLAWKRGSIHRPDDAKQPYQWLNGHAEVQGVLLVGLHDPYYLEKPAMFSSCCDRPIAEVVDLGALKASGITHIAFRPQEYQRENAEHLYTWSAAQRMNFETFLSSRCRQVGRVDASLSPANDGQPKLPVQSVTR